MPTMNALVDECLLKLSSYGLIQPRGLRLEADVSASDTTLVLSSVDQLETGLAELENELVFVISTDRATTSAEVVRGYLSSTPVAHTAGAFFKGNPPWPRHTILTALNDAIVNSYPDLFAVRTATVTASPVQTTFTLDASIEMVREVKYQLIGPSQQWTTINEFWWDGAQNTLTFAPEGPLPGSEVRVVYETRPIALSAVSEFTNSGLAVSAKKFVVSQACADLVRFMDTSRFPVAAASADDMDQNRGLTQATNVARILLTIAELEKQSERQRLRQRYKPVVSKARAR